MHNESWCDGAYKLIYFQLDWLGICVACQAFEITEWSHLSVVMALHKWN